MITKPVYCSALLYLGVWKLNKAKSMVPLNCNFIFTRVITHGTTAILQCIPVACLRGPRLVVSCNVHVSWKLTRGSVRLVEAHAWKCTSRGSSRVEVYVSWKLSRGSVRLVEAQAWNKTRMHSHARKNVLTESIALHYTNILLVNQHNVTYRLFSSAHIKS